MLHTHLMPVTGGCMQDFFKLVTGELKAHDVCLPSSTIMLQSRM